MLKFALTPLEVMLTLPLAAPALAGANVTEKFVLCPGLKVAGRVRPLRLKPVPLAEAAEIVRLVPPEFVSVPESDVELPTATVPKLRLVGFGVNCPWLVPVPERAKLALPAFVVKATLPVKLPLFGGANVSLADELLPACSVIGSVRLLIVNPAPLKAAWLTTRSAVPVLEMVMLLCWFDPAATLPKLICVGFSVKAAFPVELPARV
jgi:hypothetical protein